MMLSTFLFVVIIVIIGIIQIIFTIFGFFGAVGAALGLILIIPLLVLNAILSVILHYNCWKALPAGYRKFQPSTAALLLLIPLFNLYWVFVSFPSLGRGFDKCLSSNQLDPGIKKEALGLFYACSIVAEFCLSWVPIIGGVTSGLVFVSFLFYYIEIIKSSKAIAEMQGRLVEYPVSTSLTGSSYVEQPGTPMQKLLRLAKEYDGQLSIAQISMHMNLEIEEINKLLEEAQKYGYAEIGNHPKTGAIRYYFDLE